MLKKIFLTVRAILAAAFLLVLNACVLGTPIISPVDVVVIAGMAVPIDRLAGENTDLYWPFEHDTEILELQCDGLSVKIELTSDTALVIMPEKDMRFTRTVGAEDRQRLAYWGVTRIEIDDTGILASEDGQGLADMYFNKLAVLDAYSAELDLHSGSFLCGAE